MTSTAEKKKKEHKKKSLLVLLLYVATAFFMSWLLLVLMLTFFFTPEEIKESPLLNKVYSLANFEMNAEKELSSTPKLLDETNGLNGVDEPEISVEPLDRDEFNPAMDDLLTDSDFDQERFDAIFENMKSPIISERELSHSTFGRDVIYIYHSHSRESFLPYMNDTHKPEDAYHSQANITYVGEMLRRGLEKRGVGAAVDATDIVQELSGRGLDFNSSYTVSGERVRAASAENKDLEIFLDIHRDSLRKDSTTLEVNGKSYARLLFIVGTGHESYERNLLFAEGLDSLLAAKYPSLSKGISKKDSSQGNGVYNQDISPNAVIVEVGGVDNTLEEIHRTTEALADVLSDYYFHRSR